MRKITFLTGFAAGYVAGSAAGRERYEQITRAAQQLRSNPTVQQTTEKAMSKASGLAGSAKETVTSKVQERRSSEDTSSDAYGGAEAVDSVFVVDIDGPLDPEVGTSRTDDRMGL